MFALLLKTGTVRKISLWLVSLRNDITPLHMEATKDLDLFSNLKDLSSPPKVGPKKDPPAKMREAKKDSPGGSFTSMIFSLAVRPAKKRFLFKIYHVS